ncbi:MAG: hypothetical protein LKJ47_04810 [Bifidobacteriaceae bacterium]|jgi:hypothetical protein|nr:hypothetical protein [Bifidobacteriaceae bacterium]
MGKSRFVLNRKNFGQQILHNKKLLDDVEKQMTAAKDDDAVKVYRNDDYDHGNVVATAPASLEAKNGTLTKMLGKVHV